MMNKAIFIDRDGTININVNYLDDPERFSMYPGVGGGLRVLKDNGFKIIVVTNQSGIARGFFTESRLSEIHERMKQELYDFGVTLDGLYYCPHHPDEHCNCRKPNTELFEKAIAEHNIDVKHSFMIGDMILDVGAGTRMGLKTILIPEPHMRGDMLSKQSEWEYHPDYIADDFSDAVDWILKVEH